RDRGREPAAARPDRVARLGGVPGAPRLRSRGGAAAQAGAPPAPVAPGPRRGAGGPVRRLQAGADPAAGGAGRAAGAPARAVAACAVAVGHGAADLPVPAAAP